MKKKDRQQPAKENRKETETLAHPGDLFAETESSMASAIADMMEQDQQNAASDPEMEEEEWKPAMPVRTKEELLKKAQADGDEPEVRDDEVSGVTLSITPIYYRKKQQMPRRLPKGTSGHFSRNRKYKLY